MHLQTAKHEKNFLMLNIAIMIILKMPESIKDYAALPRKRLELGAINISPKGFGQVC